MSDSFFEDVNIDDIPDDPNRLPNNTYRFRIIGAKLDKTKNRNNQPNYVPKLGITFKYQISEGPWSTFFPISDWVRVPDGTMNKEEKDKALSWLKMRLLNWGFSLEEIQKFGPSTVEECINREFYGTTSTKEENGRVNTRIMKFDLIEDNESGYDDEPAY